jgi:hypothetical protein
VAVIVQRAFWTGRRIAQATGAVLLVATAATALGLFLWVRSYAPLYTSGGRYPQPARGVRPLSLGIKEDVQAYVVRPGSMTLAVDVSSNGRWPVRIDDLALAPAADGVFVAERVAIRRNPRFLALRTLPASGWKVRLERDSLGQQFTLTFRARCVGLPRGTYSPPVTQLRLHYRYLRFFARSQDVPLVKPIVLAC